MINIEAIKNATIETDPWPHMIIDDFILPEYYNKISILAKNIVDNMEFHDKEILWMSDLIKFFNANEESDLIVDVADVIIKEYKTISSKFPERQTSELGYFNNPRLGISMEESVGEIHDEGKNKVMALIVYLEPEASLGTLLYKENTVDSFAKEVEWKQNRALIMFSLPNKTWHSFNSSTQKRLTLNFYYERLEALEHVRNTFDEEKVLWLFDKFGQNKLIHTGK
jgi:hypothetical protein